MSGNGELGRATSSGPKRMLMETFALKMFVLASMTSMDGFLVLWEITNSKTAPSIFNQVDLITLHV